jgi:hypothetical protein
MDANRKQTPTTPDDRIYPITRWVSALIVPFLVVAFFILYVFPDRWGQSFAWEVRPRMQAMFVGAGYIGGCYLFVRTLFIKEWHRIGNGLLPVTVFVVSMLLLTFFHWDYFDLGHFPFQVWLVLYLITPVLVPWLWWHNQKTDPHTLEAGDIEVPMLVRRMMGALGLGISIFSLYGFIFPSRLIDIWVWQLDSLSAQGVSGWLALIGVGGLLSALEPRWSSWRIGLESIVTWHILVLVAAVFNTSDFKGGSLLNWYVVGIALVVIVMIALYFWMERKTTANNMKLVS